MTPPLSRERQVAVSTLLAVLPYADIMTVARLPQDLLCSGFMAFTRNAVQNKDLPSEGHWAWNQCGGKAAVVIEGVRITMRKVISRLRGVDLTESMSRPMCKSWIMDLTRADVGAADGDIGHLYFVWCERGMANDAREAMWRGVIPMVVPAGGENVVEEVASDDREMEVNEANEEDGYVPDESASAARQSYDFALYCGSPE